MVEPLSWIWLVQATLLITVVTSAVAVLLLIWQRRKPLEIHVLTHEVSKTFDDVKAEIEKRERVKPKWQLTEAAKERGLKDE
jgi:hypothetical protein